MFTSNRYSSLYCGTMLKASVIFLFALPALVSCSVEGNGRVMDHTTFITKLIQETVYEWEQRGFCTLRINEFTQAIDVDMFGWQVVGNVTYTNAFLNSIQKLEVRTMSQGVSRQLINGERVPIAFVRGTLCLLDPLYGYDVVFDELNVGQHRFTGVYGYTRNEIVLRIEKNLITNELTTTATAGTLTGGYTRMLYFPANNITEVLSREFFPTTAFQSVGDFGINILAPIMLKIAQTKIEFPKICFSNDVC